MRNAKQTIVLFQNSADSSRLCAELDEQNGVPYQQTKGSTHLQELLNQDQSPLLIVHVAQLPLALSVTNTRTVLGVGGLIVVTESSMRSHTDLLLAGADVVLSSTVSTTEILAWSSVLLRRAEGFLRAQEKGSLSSATDRVVSAGHSEHPAQLEWRLLDGGWRLLSPTGVSINLTSSERFFLESFVGQPDKRVSREALLERNATLNESSRAIDSLISRLRRKAMLQKVHLPIKSVHGWGYTFTGLLRGEDSEAWAELGLKPSTQEHESVSKYSFLYELGTQSQLEEQLQAERFDYVYYPVLDMNTEQMVGAFAVLVWRDKTGQAFRVEELVPHLQGRGLLEKLGSWAILKLHRELTAWDMDYAVKIPIYVGMPASVLLQKHQKLEVIAQPCIADQLTVIIQNLDEETNPETLKEAVAKLKKNGLTVWARYENENLLGFLQSQIDFDGVSFWRLTDRLIRGEDSQDFSQILGYVQKKQWPTLVVDVENLEQRRFAQFSGVRYVAGSNVAMELSRDGLLLSWASQQVEN